MKQESYKDQLKKRRRMMVERREGWRLAILLIMTVVIATMFFGGGVDAIIKGMFHEKKEEKIAAVGSQQQVTIPKIDKSIIAKIKDKTKAQRYTDEAGPLAHLLNIANQLTPATMRIMGMPARMVPVSKIQEDPDRYRAKPLWYAGELVDLDRPKPIPTMQGSELTRGRLRTDNGEVILFGVLTPVPKNLVPGSYVRVDGIFFKLKDDPFLKLVKAPYILGPKLREAFHKFKPVKKIDPKILAEVKDKTNKEASQIEPIPLYHLCSYVLNKDYSGNKWRSEYPEIQTTDEKMIKENPELMRGKGFTIKGSMVYIQVTAAEGNPLGIEHWSRVWLYRTGMGFFEVRVPGYVDFTKFKTDDVVVVYAHFLKRYYFETNPDSTGGRRFRKIPLFVARAIYPYVSVTPLSTTIIRYSMGLISLLLIILFIGMIRSDNKRNRQVSERIMEIRKRRRAKATKNKA